MKAEARPRLSPFLCAEFTPTHAKYVNGHAWKVIASAFRERPCELRANVGP